SRHHTITAPIVGTFYAAASPESPPFIKVGDRLTTGQTICIIEAMKIMNEIESDVDGTVVEILPDNATPVEFNQPLVVVDPA
ncbi:MAG: acetyl-CoA carboxylase biotin carboxyl carrier protein, partial [Candidatus Marinimicrobia bacterium]|nr:acetyl-CoA carboxylase biotin carboxyl carrier protein [Candidatus Neomarinimicrobiota bacterium]